MKRRLSRHLWTVGLVLLTGCLTLTGRPAGKAAIASSRQQVSLSQISITRLPPEVRLRKLHLVRPDLIQYPIDFEVYC